MAMRARLKRLLTDSSYNRLMLDFPFLLALPMVRFESNLDRGGIEDVRRLLDATASCRGEIVECGSSRCGTAILIARHLDSMGSRKRVFALDSFEGFDLEELRRERTAGLTSAADDAFTSTHFDYVTRKLDKLGYGGRVVPVKGFFQSTLPSLARRSEFSFALIDCDLQESIRFCAETVWPRIVPGGVIAFDDYDSDEFRGARLAVDRVARDRRAETSVQGMLNRLYYLKKA